MLDCIHEGHAPRDYQVSSASESSILWPGRSEPTIGRHDPVLPQICGTKSLASWATNSISCSEPTLASSWNWLIYLEKSYPPVSGWLPLPIRGIVSSLVFIDISWNHLCSEVDICTACMEYLRWSGQIMSPSTALPSLSSFPANEDLKMWQAAQDMHNPRNRKKCADY